MAVLKIFIDALAKALMGPIMAKIIECIRSANGKGLNRARS